MLIVVTDHFVLPLPPDHRFPMRKYFALRERIDDIVDIHCATVALALDRHAPMFARERADRAPRGDMRLRAC